MLLVEAFKAGRCDSFAEVDAQSVEFFTFAKLLQTGISESLFIMIADELLQIWLVLQKSDDGKLLDMGAKRNIDSFQLLARDSKFNQNFVGYGNRGEVKFLDVGSEIADFVDEFVGNVSLVLQIQILKSRVHNFKQIVLIYNRVGEFLSEI